MHLLCAHHALYAQDQCGFVQWRPCFYVVAPLDNFIYMLDGFWKYLADAMAKETKLEVHLWTASDVNIDDTWEELSSSSNKKWSRLFLHLCRLFLHLYIRS